MTISRPTAVPDNKPDLQPSELLFPIVGLGASAGGMEALLQFFELEDFVGTAADQLQRFCL